MVKKSFFFPTSSVAAKSFRVVVFSFNLSNNSSEIWFSFRNCLYLCSKYFPMAVNSTCFGTNP